MGGGGPGRGRHMLTGLTAVGLDMVTGTTVVVEVVSEISALATRN